MAVIQLPSKVFFEKVERIRLLRSSATLRSKYTGKRQTVSFPFALWVLEGTLIPMSGVDAAEWRAFLVDLEGTKNTFRLPVPGVDGTLTNYLGPEGTCSVAASARALSVQTSGWTPNAAIMKRGDYFTVNDELKMCMSDVSANASGQALITFKPSLRKPLTIGQSFSVRAPYIYASAQDEDVAQWGLERPVQHGIKITAVEAFF